jgi:C-terminal processing protease CtpA/Prc
MGGGSGEQSNFLISHFVNGDTVAVARRGRSLARNASCALHAGERAWPTPDGCSNLDPTDRGTASAGEDFSFVLQQLGRAKTVG